MEPPAVAYKSQTAGFPGIPSVPATIRLACAAVSGARPSMASTQVGAASPSPPSPQSLTSQRMALRKPPSNCASQTSSGCCARIGAAEPAPAMMKGIVARYTTVFRIRLGPGLPRPLPLRTHSAWFLSLRQHPLGEVQALLQLAQLAPQVAHLDFQDLEPGLALAPVGALAQVLGPQPERQRERRMNRGMPGLGRSSREGDSRHVDCAQHDGDRAPDRGLEGHGEILSARQAHSVGSTLTSPRDRAVAWPRETDPALAP